MRQGASGRRGGSFDAFDLVLRSASIGGVVSAESLARAEDRLAPEGGAADLTWHIAGTADALGRPALEVRLDGVVPLVCQRCLQVFAWPVMQRTELLLARNARELALLDDDDEHEVILADAPLDALTLVEDELVLTLPFVPRCERADCTARPPVAEAGPEPEPASAFAALARLQGDTAKKATD